ncbi:MAG TPA: nuclear transport factor 2 family protein [Terracidiphilus sp.]|nr:nuclear transport factor 2 family protein [Terracidiphilus sp.]
MRRSILFFLALVWMGAGVAASARAPQNGDEVAIRAALDAQVAAWNRGDIPAFMQTYENSPETTFIGTTVRKGYEPILERYRTAYANVAQMGTVTFSHVEVRLLPGSCGATEYAIVTGAFHLDRTQRGTATKDDGIFSLVWHRGSNGWKIVLDHTS